MRNIAERYNRTLMEKKAAMLFEKAYGDHEWVSHETRVRAGQCHSL